MHLSHKKVLRFTLCYLEHSLSLIKIQKMVVKIYLDLHSPFGIGERKQLQKICYKKS